ncbi:hypothetical protein Vadar_021032 [Vaccinium darrowii]|uniref:Uncharacterized protein n=1 Tax=Vaccinium darrowii TaxID=229202 RepID=A0ACB7YN87_9ERIC|nr:hypothetical protein Vadar_021032 [Vaccinium darrowii]
MLGFSLETGANSSDSKLIKNYLRLRVRMDITKPLKKGFLLKRDRKEDLWIKLQYERLSEFCYVCGRLGHTQNECKETRVTEGAKMEFGSFLRAELSNMDPLFRSNSTNIRSSSEMLATKDSRKLEETVAREKTGLKVADVIKDIPQTTVSTEDKCRCVVPKDCPFRDTVSGITPAAVDAFHDPGTGILNLSPIQCVDKGKNPLGFGEIYKGHKASPTGVGPNQQYFVEDPPDSPIREMFDNQHCPSVLLAPNPVLSREPIIQTPVLGLADSFNRLLNLKRKGPCEDEVTQVSLQLPRLDTSQYKPRARPAISDSTNIEIDDNNEVPSSESGRKRVKKRVSVKSRSSESSKKNSPIRLCNVDIQQGFDLSAEEMAVYAQREKNNSGVGRNLTIQALGDLIHANRPSIVFLMETKNNKVKLETIRRKFRFDFGSYVEPEGLAGGLALWWYNDIEIEVETSTKNLFHTVITDKADASCWAASFIYGCPSHVGKDIVWNEIREIARFERLPWLCIGDFNEILSIEDKKSGNPPCPRRLASFHTMLNECDLVDLEFKGPKFTWRNRRTDEGLIMERLDMAFANSKWRETFDKALVFVENVVGSDHNPLVLNTCFALKKVGKPFRFESMWTIEEECQQVISNAWREPM